MHTPPPHTKGLFRARTTQPMENTMVNEQNTPHTSESFKSIRTHLPEYKHPGGWWCFCASLSFSSFPFRRSGQTGPSLWRPLSTTSQHNRATIITILLCCNKSPEQIQVKLNNKMRLWHLLPLSIFTATLVTRVGLFLSIPIASASTTWPKQPSPRGFPSVSLGCLRTARQSQMISLVRMKLGLLKCMYTP